MHADSVPRSTGSVTVKRPGTAALVAERLVPDGSRRSEEEVERLRGRPAGIGRSQVPRRSLSDIMLDQLVR
jgi:hypothetical protein